MVQNHVFWGECLWRGGGGGGGYGDIVLQKGRKKQSSRIECGSSVTSHIPMVEGIRQLMSIIMCTKGGRGSSYLFHVAGQEKEIQINGYKCTAAHFNSNNASHHSSPILLLINSNFNFSSFN